MACTANHDSGLPQSRHWCATNFGCSSPLITRIRGGEWTRGGWVWAPGGGDAFSFNFNLSNASLVLWHKNHGGT